MADKDLNYTSGISLKELVASVATLTGNTEKAGVQVRTFLNAFTMASPKKIRRKNV